MRVIGLLVLTVVAAQSADNISGPAYTLLNARNSLNQSQFSSLKTSIHRSITASPPVSSAATPRQWPT